MDQGRFLVGAHVREGRPVAELATAHGVSRSWIYKLVARYRQDGWRIESLTQHASWSDGNENALTEATTRSD
jgi:transposase